VRARRRSPADDAAFRDALDAAKARRNLSDVVSRHTALKKRGRELVGLCPFHDEKSPSFEVNNAKGVFHCHGCGASGDHFTVLTKLDGLGFREAYEALTNETFPTVSPEDRARAVQEDAAARAAAIADARMMWDACVPAQGTAAETYLSRARGITMPLPAAVRFGVVPTSRDDDGHWKRPYPAAVFAVTDAAGDVVGLQRVFLLNDGSDKRWGKRSKLSLGRPRGAAVRLHAGKSGRVILCEGPEDGLSLAQELPNHSVWVALGTAMMPEVEFPPSLSEVTIAGQNDAPGRAAVEKASVQLADRGLVVHTMWPPAAYKDWNDALRGVSC
jgi:DNA primase